MTSKVGWVAQNERVPVAKDFSWIDSLRQRDEVVGNSAEHAWGADPYIKKQFVIRVLLRLRFEFRKVFKPFYSRLNRGIYKTAFKIWGRRRTVNPDQLGAGDSHSLQFVNVLDETVDLNSLLTSTSATHWVFTRGTNVVLRSGLHALQSSVRNSDEGIVLWFGDSRTAAGDFVRRPPHSVLLLRQVDVMGPVIMVSVAFLRRWGKISQVPRDLLFLVLGLDTPSNAVSLIEQPLGIGSLVWQPNSDKAEKAINLVRENLTQHSGQATVSQRPNGVREVNYALSEHPLVSIVIPTRGSGENERSYIEAAVESVIARTAYENFEIVIVADESTPQRVVDEINARCLDRVVWVRWSEIFNFSKKMNLGAAIARGEFLLFLNDDVELVSADWIQRMLSLIDIEHIAYTGALLYFDDASIQHAGHLYAGGAGHIGIGEFINTRDPNQLLDLDREVSGVTAACSLMRKSLFEDVGGFSEVFPGNYNDVDLSLKVLTGGHNIAVAAGAKLYHFESKTRDATVHRAEAWALHRRWARKLRYDHFWRPSNY